jgi:NAD(P)-dependent dehydrogenase (short-subunit alcohol dehydrogenase family)
VTPAGGSAGGALAGRTYAIAGAGGGLGPSVAEVLASAGANLALADRGLEHLDPVVEALGLDAARVDARAVDLLDEPATRSWEAAVRERFGGVDGLIHLVGGWRGGTALAEAPMADWELLHDLLIRTVQLTSRAFRDALAHSEHGRFVLVSALQAQKPSGTNAAYGAAKAAAEAWTLALADDLSGTDATANIVIINALVTPQMRAANPEKAYKTFTDAEEIAGTIAWLCSDAARKMNGRRVVLA